MMPDLYEWFETEGGPHLLVPEELLPMWRGIEGWSNHEDPNDQSDYARACRVTNWVGSVRCGDGAGIVLGGDVGPVAWIDTDGLNGGYLVQWLGIDDEAEIYPALFSKRLEEAFASEPSERETLQVTHSGTLRLIDSADIGNDLLQPGLTIALNPGCYGVSAACLDTETIMMVVRKIVLL